MFYFRQENLDQKYPKFRVLKAQKGYGIQNYTLYEDLPTIIEMSTKYPKYQHIFLLDDQRFTFCSFEISEDFKEKITFPYLQEIINEKRNIAERNTKEYFLFSQFDTIMVQQMPKKFLIGEKGEVSFRLILVYLKSTVALEFQSRYKDPFDAKTVEIFPESLQTINFLRKNLHSESFLLLYIRDSHCKGIVVEKGFYTQIETINLGVNLLMQIYRDNGISKYRYKRYEEIESNPFAKDLVVQTLEFYSQMLCKWIKEKGIGGKNIFVISPVMKNVHFMEIFNKEYHKWYNNYIIPVHYAERLDLFGKQWEPEDIDALIYINTVKYKELQEYQKEKNSD